MSKSWSNFITISSFVLFMAILGVGYGFLACKMKLFPYATIQQVYWTAESLLGRPHHLYPIRHNISGAKTHLPGQVSPGVTLLTSYWPDQNWAAGAKLIDESGNTLHHWTVDASKLWPVSPHEDSISGTKNHRSNYIHGSYVFPNGDLLLNIEYLGLFRIDSCGALVWSLPYRTHHSIHPTEDGNFWVSGMVWIDEGHPREVDYKGLSAPFAEDTAILVSPEGELLKEVRLLKAIFESEYKDVFWKYRRRKDDISHLNDVEPLPTSLAPLFPEFNVGDLLLSFKEISLVSVISQEGEVKLFETQLFNNQHDPDFEPTGWISVFDNRADGSYFSDYLAGSRIQQIKGNGGTTRTAFQTQDESVDLFYTKTGGKHQLLLNGNRLITEANAGRVFEINADGTIVWEWIQTPFDEKYVPEVLEGTRYDLDHNRIKSWGCSIK